MSKKMLKRQFTLPPTLIGRKIFLFCLWVFWVGLLIIALLLSYAWTQRYDYLERGAKRILADNNISAELEIVEIGRMGLQLKNIELRDMSAANTAPFFTAERIEASYDWRNALNGHFDRLTIIRPTAVLEIDKSGQLVAGWLPSESDEETSLIFPKDGIFIKDGNVNVRSPYGALSLSAKANIYDKDYFDADFNIANSALSVNGYDAIISGPFSVKVQDNAYQMSSQIDLTNLNSAALQIDHAKLGTDLSITKKEGAWTSIGPISLRAENVLAEAASVKHIELRSDNKISFIDGAGGPETLSSRLKAGRWTSEGPISLRVEEVQGAGTRAETFDLRSNAKVIFVADTGSIPSVLNRLLYDGDIDIIGTQLALSDAKRRHNLARTLSLSGILSKSPILQAFAPHLREQTQTLLSGADVSAALSVVKENSGLKVTAREDVLISKDGVPWRLRPIDTAPLIALSAEPNEGFLYKGTSDFSFEKPGSLPLSLSGAAMEFTMSYPAKLEAVTAFSGQVSLPKSWQANGAKEGDLGTVLAARPTNIAFTRQGEASAFDAQTNFTLSGDVPGGYVRELAGRGDLKINTMGDQSRLEFTSNHPLTYARADLTSGWILENGTLELGAPFVMSGSPERRVIDISAQALRMRMHDNDIRDFQTEITSIGGQGILSVDGDVSAQRWDLTLIDGRVRSAEFPITETDIFSPQATIKTTLTEGQPPIFDIYSPNTEVSSSLVGTDDIAVRLSGTPENLTVNYDAKLFRFSDPALPEIPMAGQTRLVGARWTGESVARLPEDPDTPIDISFEFEDGVGTADIEIKTLNFTPKGLQPQNLVKNLSGKLAEVDGLVSASIKLGFGEGVPLTSSGTAVIENMGLAIAAGPISGLNTSLEFSSFFPLKTSGRQIARLEGFDPGFPLPAGEIEFELLPGKIEIHRAEWPIAGGRIYIEPLIWDFEAPENMAVLILDAVSIQDMVERSEDSKFEITGAVSGRLPVTISGVNVNVVGGKVSVPSGGSIRFTHPGTDLAGAQNRAAGVAFDALKDFEYDTLEANIDGPLDGLIRLRTIFSGSNKEVYSGQPFEFDLELEGELLNLIRELNPETQKNRALSGNIIDLILNKQAVPDP